MDAVKRTFFVGDEWLFYKIYSGPKTLETFLVGDLYEVLEGLISSRIIDKFFFIRYADPDYHLRIRFHLRDVNRINELVLRINKVLTYYVENRLVAKVVVDTYVRELERYGKNVVADIEDLFCTDSLFVLQYLRGFERKDEWRWLMSVRMIDRLLDKFELRLIEKVGLFGKLVDTFSAEFNMNKSLKVQLDNKFREAKKLIGESINHSDIEDGTGINMFLESNAKVISRIVKLKNDKQLEVSFENLLGSIIHMHLNRLFRTKQRLHEFVIYYLMQRYYTSLIARLKYSKGFSLS